MQSAEAPCSLLATAKVVKLVYDRALHWLEGRGVIDMEHGERRMMSRVWCRAEYSLGIWPGRDATFLQPPIFQLISYVY